MVKLCAIKNCKSYKQHNSDISLHQLPINKHARERWLAAIPNALVESKYKVIYICSMHFTSDSFIPFVASGKKILKRTAVPTIFNKTTIMENNKTDEELTDHFSILKDINYNLSINCALTTNVQNMQKSENEKITAVDLQKEIGIQTDNNTKDVQVQTYVTSKKFEELLKLRSKKNTLKQVSNQRRKRIKSMKNFIKYLKDFNCSSKEVEDVLKNNFSDFSLDLLQNEKRNNSKKRSVMGRRYTACIKQFALTLFFYSPRAYEFVRKKINLPHSRVIRSWLSNVNIEPGFISESFYFALNINRF